MRVLVTAVLAVGLLAGCSAEEASSSSSPASSPSSSPASSPSSSVDPSVTAYKLAEQAGLAPSTYDTDELFVQSAAEVGTTRIYTFPNQEARDNYLAVAEGFGGYYRSGDSNGAVWVVAGDDELPVRMTAEALHK